MIDMFLIKIEQRHVAGQVLLNGIPQQMLSADGSLETTLSVNQWIVPGENKLEVEISTLPSSDAVLRINLKRMSQNENRQAGDIELASFDLSLKPAKKMPYPHQIERSFVVENPPPSELWSKHSQIDLTEAVQREIFAHLKTLNTAFAQKDLDTVSRLLQMKAIEMANSYGFPQAKAVPQQRSFFEGLMQESNWAMSPLRFEDLSFHLIAYKRIVWVTRNNFAPALESAPSTTGAAFKLPIYFALIRKAWIIVR